MKKDAPYYLQQGLKKLQGLFTKEQLPKQEKTAPDGTGQEDTEAEVPQEPKPLDYPKWQSDIRDSLVNGLQDIIRDPKTYADKNLLVYVDNEELYNQALYNGLAEYLNDWVELKKGHLFHSITLHQGKPSPGLLQTRLDEQVCIAVERKAAQQSDKAKADEQKPALTVNAKAVISVVSGCCAFEGGSMELSATAEQTWNIGFGSFSNFGGRQVRYNQIALQYANPEGRERDPYPVSRAHAHITYRPGSGFVFYVDPRGIGKRTAIQKGEKVHKVTNSLAGVLLEDGDIIILNNEMFLFRLQ